MEAPVQLALMTLMPCAEGLSDTQETPQRSSRRCPDCLRSASRAAVQREESRAPPPVPSDALRQRECPVPMFQPTLHPSAPRRAAPATVQVHGLGPTSSEPAGRPFGPSVRPRCGSAYLLPRLSALGCLTSLACAGPMMPSVDFCMLVGSACSSRSSPRWRTACRSPRVRHRTFCA